MSYLDYKKVNLYMFNFEQPNFESTYNIFISNLIKTDETGLPGTNSQLNVKSDGLKLLCIKDNSLQIEFLPSSNNFYNFINTLDAKAKDEIIKKGLDWFGNNLNIDTVNNIYKQSIQLPVKLPGFPILNFKISENCKITGTRRKKLTIDDLKPNMEIELSFIIEGVYFYKNKCNLVYCVNCIKVINGMCQTLENLFSDNDELNKNDNNIDSETNDITMSIC